MAWATVDGSQVQLVMKFKEAGEGWSEKLYIGGGNTAGAQATALALVNMRLNLLCKSSELLWGVLNLIGPGRDAATVLDAYPKPGLFAGVGSTPEEETFTPNDPGDAVRVRMENTIGSWSNRWLHSVPDSEKNQADFVSTFTATTSGPPAVVQGTTTWIQILSYYLYLIKSSTVMYREVPGGSPPTRQTDTPNKVLPVKMGWHKTGAPFGQRRGRAVPR